MRSDEKQVDGAKELVEKINEDAKPKPVFS